MDRGRRPAIARRRRTTWRLRAEAHVVRLAALYATLDCDDPIALPHLEATLAVWRYSADSARWIFGDSLAEPHLFRRNKRAHEIDRAVAVLEEAGRLHRVSISISDGRPPGRNLVSGRQLRGDMTSASSRYCAADHSPERSG